MRQHAVQCSALVLGFQNNRNFARVPEEHLAVCHDNKTGRVVVGIIDPLRQNLQPVCLRRILRADGCLRCVLILRHLLGGIGIVLHADLLPLRMLIQVVLALHQGLRMGIHRADALQRCARNTHQAVPDRDDLLADNVILEFKEKVVIL